MFETLSSAQIDAFRKLVQGADLIAAATGKPVTQVVDLHLPPQQPDPQTRGLALVRSA